MFSSTTTAVGNKDPSLTSDSSFEKKFSRGFFFFLLLLAKSSQQTGTQPPTHMRAREARTHQPAHVSRWICRLRSCGLICKVGFKFHTLTSAGCTLACHFANTPTHTQTLPTLHMPAHLKKKTPQKYNIIIHLTNTDAEDHFKCFQRASIFSAISHIAYK